MNKKTYILNTIEWFSTNMRRKLMLPRNLQREQWTTCGFNFITDGLDLEVRELQQSLETGNYQEAVKEAVDVANYAMMIADIARQKVEKKEAS